MWAVNVGCGCNAHQIPRVRRRGGSTPSFAMGSADMESTSFTAQIMVRIVVRIVVRVMVRSVVRVVPAYIESQSFTQRLL